MGKVAKVKLVVPVGEDRYRELVELAEKFGVSVEEFVGECVESLAVFLGRLSNSEERVVASLGPGGVLASILELGWLMSVVSSRVLDGVGGAGLFSLMDVNIDLNDGKLWFHFVSLDEGLLVDTLDITCGSGFVQMAASMLLELANERDVKRLRSVVDEIRGELSEGLLGDWSAGADLDVRCDNGFCEVVFTCVEEELGYLPKLQSVIGIFERILDSVSKS